MFVQRFYFVSEKKFLFQSDGVIKAVVEKTFLPDPNLQRSLAFEAESDPMNNDQEQTWPTREELEKAQAEKKSNKKTCSKRNIRISSCLDFI